MTAPRRTVRAGIATCVLVFATACSSGSSAPVTTVAATPATTSSAATATLPVAEFAPLHPAVGFGLLRKMTLEERPGSLDVVLYEALPNEMPRVAGVITTVGQTPLSHVNLRAVQDNVPNAYIADALSNPGITGLIGRYVKYTVTSEGFTVVSATQAEVEAHHAAARPASTQTPERDLSVRTIAPLSEIGFDDWKAYGVKAANVATLATFDLPDTVIPDGFAVPFAFYDEFMKANGLYDRVAKMLADKTFTTDPDAQDALLADLRKSIKDAPLPESAMTSLDAMHKSFPEGSSVRCRSSTNNEDLPNFSGAGLYDSKTQHADEGHIAKCIKQVFASVWNLRAFLARDYYRIDHLATAMGVLVIPSVSDEKANGVAVSIDPVYDTPGAMYVNTQLGEDLVTNPDGVTVPEALLLGDDGSVTPISRSSLAEPGEFLMTDAQVQTLRASLATIHERFAALYNVTEGEKFAMEVEFKITNDDKVMIKQARSWVFN